MTQRYFLNAFPTIATRDPEEFEGTVGPRFSVTSIDVGDVNTFDSGVNSFQLSGMGLTYVRYGSPIRLRLSQSRNFTYGVPLSGSGEVSSGHVSAVVDSDHGGATFGPGADAVLEYGAGFSNLFATFPPETLTRKLSALLDQAIVPPLDIEYRAPFNQELAQSLGRLVRFLAEEIDNTKGALPPMVSEEIEQGIVVGYLLANRSNYTHLLTGSSSSVSPRQVTRTIDFLEAHWDEPVTIEVLSKVAGTSARNLFHTFRRTRGLSPMAYARRLRLGHARDLFADSHADRTVTWVAYACGFSNLGYFAREYFRAFGEKPSVTLARSHGPRPRAVSGAPTQDVVVRGFRAPRLATRRSAGGF